jgi:hypothetical protein
MQVARKTKRGFRRCRIKVAYQCRMSAMQGLPTCEHGGMAERFKAVVLKTTVAVMSPGVRIPLPPPDVALSSKECGEVA